MAALLARIVRDRGRDDEALRLTMTAEGLAAADDVEAQALWRSVRAPIIARAGDPAEAERLARDAVGLARDTDVPVLQADTLADLAEVLDLAGRTDEARDAIVEALGLYATKGDVVSAARAKERADRLAVGPLAQA
jgi:tetratricopeptide (TPR) repeat protein